MTMSMTNCMTGVAVMANHSNVFAGRREDEININDIYGDTDPDWNHRPDIGEKLVTSWEIPSLFNFIIGL